MRTLQEKYSAVVEGNFSKEQFRRDAIQQLPNVVSKLNSYEDTVAILKNKGMIAEVAKVDPADLVVPSVLDKGIEAELGDKVDNHTEQEHAKAKKKAAKKLVADPLAYTEAEAMPASKTDAMQKVKLNEAIEKIILSILSEEAEEEAPEIADVEPAKDYVTPLTNAIKAAYETDGENVEGMTFEVDSESTLENGVVEITISVLKNGNIIDDLKFNIQPDSEVSIEGVGTITNLGELGDGIASLSSRIVSHWDSLNGKMEESQVTELRRDNYERIEGLTNLKMLEELLKIAENIYQDYLDSGDVFEPSDVTEYLSFEISKRLQAFESAIDQIGEEKVDLTKRLPELSKPLMDIGKELDQKLKAAGFQTKIFMGKTDVPKEVYDVIEDNEVAAGIAFAQYTDGTGKNEVLDIVTNGNKLKELEEVLKSLNIPAENGGKPQRFGPNLVQTTIRASVA